MIYLQVLLCIIVYISIIVLSSPGFGCMNSLHCENNMCSNKLVPEDALFSDG